MTARQGASTRVTPRVGARWRALRAPKPGGADEAVLPAKLRPPQARVRLVERRALLDELARVECPLIVVSAPAGAGKTTVLRQWAESDPRPFAWVQLDEADSDPVVFLTYVSRALASVADVDPSVHDSLSLAVPPVRERVLPLLGEALAAAPPFVLVLDDAHVLRGSRRLGPRRVPAAWSARLRRSWRSDRAPTPRSRWRACAPAARSPRSVPRFSRWMRTEVAQLLRLHGCVADEETAGALLAATEGWATGLQLACLAGAGRPSAEWLGDIRGGRREIAEYLTSEVLDAQPADVQEFLLRTSVLLELTPAPVRAGLGARRGR